MWNKSLSKGRRFEKTQKSTPLYNSEAHSEPFQISKTELFAKTVNAWKLPTNFPKSSTLDIWLGCGYNAALVFLIVTFKDKTSSLRSETL